MTFLSKHPCKENLYIVDEKVSRAKNFELFRGICSGSRLQGAIREIQL